MRRETEIQPPVRWIEREGASGDTLEDRASAFLRGTVHPADLGGDVEVAATALTPRRGRVDGGQRPRWSLRSPWPWRWALAVGLILIGGGGIAAREAIRRWLPVAVSIGDPAVTGRVSTRRTTSPRGRSMDGAPVVSEDDIAAPLYPSRTTQPLATATALVLPARKTKAPTETPPVALPDPLALETAQLERALIRLRQHGDASGALAELRAYLDQFPAGALAPEARMARAEALLLLDRRDDALAALADLPLGPVGREGELRVIRAELRARLDCGRAAADFDAVLQAPAAASALVERALHGRASCRLRSGQVDLARGDLVDYLRRYPAGQFAAEVREHLRRLP